MVQFDSVGLFVKGFLERVETLFVQTGGSGTVYQVG